MHLSAEFYIRFYVGCLTSFFFEKAKAKKYRLHFSGGKMKRTVLKQTVTHTVK